MTVRPNVSELTLSGMKAQMSKKKPLKVAKKKAPVKVSTDVKAKAKKADKPKAVKVPFETHETTIAKLTKVKLAETTRNGKTIKVGSNKTLTLESLPERRELVIKINGKVACEIYPNRNGGYRFCVKLDKDVKIPKDATVKTHEAAKAPWKDIIVATPDVFISQFVM